MVRNAFERVAGPFYNNCLNKSQAYIRVLSFVLLFKFMIYDFRGNRNRCELQQPQLGDLHACIIVKLPIACKLFSLLPYVAQNV